MISSVLVTASVVFVGLTVVERFLAHAPQSVFGINNLNGYVQGGLWVLAKPATPAEGFDAAQPDPATSWTPHRVFNIGNSSPTPLLEFINALEVALGRKAIQQLEPMQPGDVEATAADTTAIEAWVGFRPSTPMAVGVAAYADWYRQFYGC